MNAITSAHTIIAQDEQGLETHPLFQPVATGVILVDGVEYMRGADSGLSLKSKIRPQDLLQDELVRKVLGFALPLSAMIGRFVQHTYDDADSLVELLDQNYQVKRGGKAGNLTFTTFDQLMKVEVTRAKIIDFGPSLAQAKELLDECVAEWSGGADENLKALVTRAFNVENGGLVNRSALLGLLRHDIADERWRRAMKAIQDAIEIRGTKRYVRIYHRPSTDDQWINVPLDAARA